MTHVPPIRLSSATSVLAPWRAAMRAARTPPDPAPMTKKSTSKAMGLTLSAAARERLPASLELDALLLHFLAGADHDVGRQLIAPGRGDAGQLLQKDRRDRDIILARRAFEEGRDVGQLFLGHFRSEQRRRLVVCLTRG